MGAGVLSLILSLSWRRLNLLLNLTFSNDDLGAGTALGIILLATFLLSLILIFQRGTTPLVILNWLLVVDAVVILFFGTFIWISTLHEYNHYHTVFRQQDNTTKIMIQDTLKCCGYYNATDGVALGGNFCPNEATAIAANSFCVLPIIKFADSTLNNIFSTVYGFMAIVAGLFFSTLCIIKKRQEMERFQKIFVKQSSQAFFV